MQTYSTKNITYSKAGATITCPVCQDSNTYQIGQLDREKWALVRGKYRCADCRAMPAHVPVFSTPIGSTDEATETDIDKLLSMVDIWISKI